MNIPEGPQPGASSIPIPPPINEKQLIAEAGIPDTVVSILKTDDVHFFETYQIRPEDLATLQDGYDMVVDSGLVDVSIFDDLRIVTYDSNYFYILTKGEHVSQHGFIVENKETTNKSGFKLFSIPHHGSIGRKRDDYQTARAWICFDEVEKTQIGGKKFPLFLQDRKLHSVLSAVFIPAKTAYIKRHRGEDMFPYFEDCIVHEVGHIERRLLDLGDDKPPPAFPSPEQEKRFRDMVETNQKFHVWVKNMILRLISEDSLHEMYAIMIEREAKKRYHPDFISKKDSELAIVLSQLHPFEESKENARNVWALSVVNNFFRESHVNGELLVHVLEEQFPDFAERKAFVQSVLRRDKAA